MLVQSHLEYTDAHASTGSAELPLFTGLMHMIGIEWSLSRGPNPTSMGLDEKGRELEYRWMMIVVIRDFYHCRVVMVCRGGSAAGDTTRTTVNGDCLMV